ncbi:hypothetical protein K438DRAFT_1806174 [Mycena galopus ATCC 62051]|nr:hypothetical protein K438DRAFT_1806174 [Mycena galopus ATCC 62051]
MLSCREDIGTSRFTARPNLKGSASRVPAWGYFSFDLNHDVAARSLRIAISSIRTASIRARNASTETGVVPGVPAASQPIRTPTTFMSFAMPDISIQHLQPQPQIPYSPDFWESAQKSQEIPAAVPDLLLPKLSVISELGTSVSHNLHVEICGSSPVEQAPRSDGKGGIFQDMSEDLGIPSPKVIKAGVSNFFQSFR